MSNIPRTSLHEVNIAIFQLRYRQYLPTFAAKRHIGEVVFTVRAAYQALNTKLEPNPPGSYFNDICNFVTEIVRERAAHAERVRIERSRKAQSHRQELQDVRDAAETLQKLKKGNRTKARYFYSAGSSCFPTSSVCQTKRNLAAKSSSAVVVSDGEQSDDHSDTGSVVYVKPKPKPRDPAAKDSLPKDPVTKDSTTGEAADAMAIDEPTKVRLSFLYASARPTVRTNRAYGRFPPVGFWPHRS